MHYMKYRKIGINALGSVLRLAFLGMWLLTAFGAEARDLKVTTGVDNPPYTDEHQPDGGSATRLVKAALENLGYSVKLEWLPWRRGFELTKKGSFQATFPYLRTAAREADFYYSDAIYSDDSFLWSRREDHFTADQPQRLVGRTICVPQGYASPLVDWLQDHDMLAKVTISHPDSVEKCVDMLAAGRVDALSGQEEEIGTLARPRDLGDRIIHDQRPLARLQFYVIFPKADPNSAALARNFNESLRKMRVKG